MPEPEEAVGLGRDRAPAPVRGPAGLVEHAQLAAVSLLPARIGVEDGGEHDAGFGAVGVRIVAGAVAWEARKFAVRATRDLEGHIRLSLKLGQSVRQRLRHTHHALIEAQQRGRLQAAADHVLLHIDGDVAALCARRRDTVHRRAVR